jgi:type II secretory pathway pseudopilin PulG
MKIHASNRFSCQRGMSLIECLVYISMWLAITGIASAVFYKAWDNSKHLRRNADNIVQALHAGELWRADVRSATGPMENAEAGDRATFRIPTTNGAVLYTFADGSLRRQAPGNAPEQVLLAHVKTSRMQSDARRHVTAWRWELELQPVQKKPRMLPLFTFESVSGSAITR